MNTQTIVLAVAAACLLPQLAPIATADHESGPGPLEEPIVQSGKFSASPPPAWYTPLMHEKVLEAGAQGMGYNYAEDQKVPVNVSFIKPGARMIWPQDCTMGFVIDDLEIVTAGHCLKAVKPNPQEILDTGIEVDPTWELNEARREALSYFGDPTDTSVVLLAGRAAPDVIVWIGTTKEGSIRYNNSGDFGVVDIKPTWENHVDPTVDKILGPQGGVYTDVDDISSENPVAVKFVGHGAVIGAGGTPRTGLVTVIQGNEFWCHCPNINIDSGAPVLSVGSGPPFGKAFGIVSGFVVPDPNTNTPEESKLEWMRGTLMTAISDTVVEQHLTDANWCQGEIRVDYTWDLGEHPDIVVPYVMLYDDKNQNRRMDEGEQFQNKATEAWWMLRFYQEKVPPLPSPPGARSASGEPPYTTNAGPGSCS